jgi:hypothetical protein
VQCVCVCVFPCVDRQAKTLLVKGMCYVCCVLRQKACRYACQAAQDAMARDQHTTLAHHRISLVCLASPHAPPLCVGMAVAQDIRCACCCKRCLFTVNARHTGVRSTLLSPISLHHPASFSFCNLCLCAPLVIRFVSSLLALGAVYGASIVIVLVCGIFTESKICVGI